MITLAPCITDLSTLTLMLHVRASALTSELRARSSFTSSTAIAAFGGEFSLFSVEELIGFSNGLERPTAAPGFAQGIPSEKRGGGGRGPTCCKGHDSGRNNKSKPNKHKVILCLSRVQRVILRQSGMALCNRFSPLDGNGDGDGDSDSDGENGDVGKVELLAQAHTCVPITSELRVAKQSPAGASGGLVHGRVRLIAKDGGQTNNARPPSPFIGTPSRSPAVGVPVGIHVSPSLTWMCLMGQV